jgi:tRNA (guanine-N7-)-methyltransferase
MSEGSSGGTKEKKRRGRRPENFVDGTPITAEGERPQKRFYRQRAHCNPLAHNDSYVYPISPDHMQWEDCNNKQPTVLDVGCGFGGLTLALAALLPNETVLGMEIRAKVAEYVRLRIVAARKDGVDQKGDVHVAKSTKQRHDFLNCSVLRTNSMKFLPNYFAKGSIHKLFFCFPDPHFKRKNFSRRIISVRLLSEYAYVLKPDVGKLYCITDVKELHDWHVAACDAHPSFRRILVSDDDDAASNNAEAADPCIAAMKTETEEGQKVDRNKGAKYYAVYQRIPNEYCVNASNFFA